ncbi:hypothetical protein JL720_5622 [Aureococcus anophagefferens]|nr:hypothetical protein JL720_5622 [Aureococcus anophagefferens]
MGRSVVRLAAGDAEGNLSPLWAVPQTVVTILGNTSYIDWDDWHHYCLTYDGPTSCSTSTARRGHYRVDSGNGVAEFYVGADLSGYDQLTGAIDELYVYTSALDREAISVLYGSVTASPTVTPAPSTYYFEGTLRAYYSFDEGNATDATGAYSGETYNENRVARNFGPTESRDGGDALYFDGSIYVQLPDALTSEYLTGNAERTICLWARIDDWNGGFLFEYGSAGWDGASFGLAAGDAEGNLTLALGGAYETVVTILGNTSYIDWDDWHHYCLTYDGTDLVLYFDGLAEATTALTLETGVAEFYVGADLSGYDQLTGAIDELYVYASALDPGAISVLYGSVTASPTVTPAPSTYFFEGTLLAYYPLDGGNVTDVHGTYSVDAWDGGFFFSYGAAQGGAHDYFALGAAASEGNVTVRVDRDREVRLPGRSRRRLANASGYWDDWHHYCLAYDGADVALYFDGAAAWSRTIAANTGAAVELTLGSRSGADYFTGALDEVYVYASALDAAGAAALCGRHRRADDGRAERRAEHGGPDERRADDGRADARAVARAVRHADDGVADGVPEPAPSGLPTSDTAPFRDAVGAADAGAVGELPPTSAPTGSPSQTPSAAPSSVPTSPPTPGPTATFAPTAPAAIDLAYAVATVLSDADDGFDAGGFASFVQASVETAVANGTFAAALAAAGVVGSVSSVGAVAVSRTTALTPAPSLAPTTAAYLDAGYDVQVPETLTEADLASREWREAVVVTLRTTPAADVAVTYASDDLWFYSSLASDEKASRMSTTFRPGDKNATVYASMRRDRVDRGASFVAAVDVAVASDGDANYAPGRFASSHNVTVYDVDTSDLGAWESRETRTDDGLFYAGEAFDLFRDEGGTFTISVRLTSIPKNDVTVALRGAGGFAAVEPAANFTFEPEAWNVPHTVSLTAADDDLLTGDVVHRVYFESSSAAAAYDGLRSGAANLTVLENDVAYCTVSAKKLTVGANGDGATFGDAYFVSLSAAPSADVVVTVSTADAATALSPRTLVFSRPTTGTPRASTRRRSRPYNPVAPVIGLSAPDTVGVCDGVVLDASGATGGGSRTLIYAWALQILWEPDDEAQAASVTALVAALDAATFDQIVRLSLSWDALLPGKKYTFLVSAANFLGETTTASHTLLKSAAPSPNVQFQGTTESMVRSDPKSLRLDVSLPSLNCTDQNVSSNELTYFWSAPREDLVASVGGGAEQMVAIGGDVLLDGSASYDPDNATAAGPLAFSWTAADSLGAAASFPASTSASAKALAFVATAADGWGPDTYAITLVVSRGTRTATKTVSLTVSSDAYIPSAAITDFDESVKYNPTPDSYAAIYFTTSSPDPDRTCCDTRWAVVGDAGDASGLISKDPSAASPMLVDLGNTLPNTVYNFRLTATDGIGSSASTVVALAINGAPTSGTFYVAPESGTALTTSFEFAMDSWTDDVDDYPLTYEFGYLDGAAKTFKPLVSDRYSTSWYATTMPKLASDNATCVGRVFDRYDAYAERSYGIMVLELVISTEDLSSFASDSIGESLDTGSGEEALALISSVASVIGAGGAAAANRTAEEQAAEAAAQQSLIEDLMKATLSATSLVSTDTSSAATGQVLDTVAFLVASPDALSENTQTDAIGLLGNVVGGALSSGMDAGAAGSSATALSGVLDASLFKKNDTAASVANDMTAVVASLSAAMIANAFGGQAKSIVSPNLEVSSFRTDCGTRSDAYALSSGAAVAMPDDAMDAAGGGGACAANGGGGRRRLEAAAENVDVRVSQMKNVYESTGAAGDVNSDLVQVELGSDGGTAAINGLSDPIVLVIQFEAYDEMLDTRFDNSKFMRQGTCYDMDDFLTWDDCPGNPATYNCSQPQYLPECTFWDENRSRWSGDNCTVRNYTAYNVTCACTHLTDFAGATKDVGSTASAVVATGANMNLAQLMEALVVLITLLATLGVFVFACVKGRQLDKQDFNNREELRREALPDAFLKKVVASRETEHVALSAAFKAKARRPWIMARSPFAVYTRSIRPVRGWCNTALYSFVMAMRREHKILQIFYLPDGTYTRTERITVLCVLVFGTLACNAIFLSVLSKIQPCVDFKAMVAKGIFSTLSAFGSTLVYILFAYAFGKTGDAISDVDHFLGVDPANLDDEAKGRVKRRKAVLTAVANLDGAKHRQKLVERRLAKDLETMFKYRKGQVGTARQLQAEDRIAFTEIHRVKRTKAQIHVDKMQLALLKAKKKFDVYVKKQADARKEEKRKELFEMKGAWARFKYRRQKDKPMYSLTLDEQALYEAEEVELARMSFLPRTLYRKFVSPIKRAFRKEKKTWPTHCEQDEDNEVCIPPAEEGDDEPAECTCPDTLYDYCGGGNSNAASMAWLEMALASVVIALFISSSLVLFMTKGVVPTIARGCTACGAKPPTEDPDPKRGLAGLVERVDHEAKAKRGIKVRGYGDDSTTVTFASRRSDLPSDSDSDSDASSEWRDEVAKSTNIFASLSGGVFGRKSVARPRRRSNTKIFPGAAEAARDPWIQHETLDLDNLRVNLGAQVPEPGLDRWPRPGERGLTADGSSTLSGRPATWKCPCGAVVPVPVRRDHLRYDCLPYRDSFEGAARKWLAANDPSDAKALVDSVAREGRCAPGEALCALSVCRKGGVAIRKLANQDYRDEMVLAAEVIDASDLLGRWVKGSPLKRRKPPKLKPVVRRRSSVNAGMLGADAKYEVKARGDLGASKRRRTHPAPPHHKNRGGASRAKAAARAAN